MKIVSTTNNDLNKNREAKYYENNACMTYILLKISTEGSQSYK